MTMAGVDDSVDQNGISKAEMKEDDQQIQTDDHDDDDDVVMEEEKVDDEGLRVDGYDVIICGTGLIQSILASALSRAGKRILHCDGNELYGELHSVVSLSNWMDHLKKKKHPSSNQDTTTEWWSLPSEGALVNLQIHSHGESIKDLLLEEGLSVSTPYGHGVVKSISNNNNSNNDVGGSVAIQLENWKLANDSHVTVYYGIPTNNNNNNNHQEYVTKLLESRETVIANHTLQRRALMTQKRNFYMDLTPGLIFASGNAVQGLVQSSVAEYCEFKNMLGLYIFGELPNNKNNTRKSTSTKNNNKDETKHQVLSRVPCSKGDVFATKLLTPAEKRRLMKVLQLASDFAIAQTATSVNDNNNNNDNEKDDTTDKDEKEESISSHNERQLQQGRSLYRPQNKSISTSALETLQQYIEENKVTFDQYLLEEHKLSERLRHIVLYALALCSSPTVSVADGMNNLCMHLNSLGKYGKTALLVPLYGAGELTQAFCRSAAVHGATYLLRRSATKILLSDSSTTTPQIINGVSLSPSTFHDESKQQLKYDKPIRAPHVVIPNAALPYPLKQQPSQCRPKKRVLRRISIISGKLVHGEDNPSNEQRHVIIIPPNSRSSVNNSHVIYGVALDESVSIAPAGSTILHLSTIINDDTTNDEKEDTSLQQTVQELIDCCKVSSKDGNHQDDESGLLQEIYHVSFSYEMSDSSTNGVGIDDNIPNGLHLCNSPISAITEFDTAFIHAKEIFEKIIGGDNKVDFLSLSTEMEEVINNNQAGRMARDEEDDDGRMLESAMCMLQSNKVSTESNDDDDDETQKSDVLPNE